jgi:hypothetical protein
MKTAENTRVSSFSFRIPSAAGTDTVPEFRCRQQGQYTALQGNAIQQELGLRSSMGRWFVRVSSGSELLNITEIDVTFETSTLNIKMGATAVSSLVWTSDSAVLAAAPGYRRATREGASGWGRNVSITASSSDFSSACLYSYPDPVIKDVAMRERISVTGSFSLLFAGFYFVNVDSSHKSRFMATTCLQSLWSSDTSVRCRAPKISIRERMVSVSIENSAVAELIQNLTRSELHTKPVIISHMYSSSVPFTGSYSITLVGLAFGTWDSSCKVRLRASASSVTQWLQDTAISVASKRSLGSARNHTFVLSAADTFVEFSSFRAEYSNILQHASNIQSLVSTGSQFKVLSGFNVGIFASTLSVTLTQSAAQSSLWFSDSVAICKTSAGYAKMPEKQSISVSLDSNTVRSPSMFSYFQPLAVHVNITSLKNDSASILDFSTKNMGIDRLNFNVSVQGSVCSNASWISDSRIICRYSGITLLDFPYLEINISSLDTSDSADWSSSISFVPNPVFIPSPRPIALTFIPLLFMPMPEDVRNILKEYTRFGPLDGFPRVFNRLQERHLTLQYAEIAELDIVMACNHTQVYLKYYQPIQIDAKIDISLVNEDDGSSLDHIICYGKTSLFSALSANAFASTLRVLLSFCPNVTVARSVLRLNVSVTNETGSTIHFGAQSCIISIATFKQTSLTFFDTFNESTSTVSAGRDELPSAKFLINSTICDRIQFKYVFQLSCLLSTNKTSTQVMPFITRSNFSSPVTLVHEHVSRSCAFIVSGLIAMHPGECFIAVTVPLFPTAMSLSRNITVINGDPFEFRVVGKIIAHSNEGSIIWSSNATGAHCLAASLADAFNNTVLQCHNSFFLSASFINLTQYPLYGPTRGVSDCKGGLMWCSTRVTQSGVIELNVTSAYFVKTISSRLLVDGQGSASKILLLSDVTQTARTFEAGSAMPPVQIQVSNSVGMALKQTGSIFIRVRIRLRNSTSIRLFCSSFLHAWSCSNYIFCRMFSSQI